MMEYPEVVAEAARGLIRESDAATGGSRGETNDRADRSYGRGGAVVSAGDGGGSGNDSDNDSGGS